MAYRPKRLKPEMAQHIIGAKEVNIYIYKHASRSCLAGLADTVSADAHCWRLGSQLFIIWWMTSLNTSVLCFNRYHSKNHQICLFFSFNA